MPELVGELVPLVMIPRYSTYVGNGDFSTAPLDVEAYDTAVLTFWRGYMWDVEEYEFQAVFEESHDAYEWTQVGSTIDTANDADVVTLELSKRWLRVTITLAGGAFIMCWAVGSLQKRLP